MAAELQAVVLGRMSQVQSTACRLRTANVARLSDTRSLSRPVSALNDIYTYANIHINIEIQHNMFIIVTTLFVLYKLLWALSGGMLVWLSVWGEVQICMWLSRCHCHSLCLARLIQMGFTFLVLPFWYWLTWVVPDKIQKSRKTICVCACAVRVNINVPQHPLCDYYEIFRVCGQFQDGLTVIVFLLLFFF